VRSDWELDGVPPARKLFRCGKFVPHSPSHYMSCGNCGWDRVSHAPVVRDTRDSTEYRRELLARREDEYEMWRGR